MQDFSQHMDEVETDLLPQLVALLSSDELCVLGVRFHQVQNTASLLPQTPETVAALKEQEESIAAGLPSIA
jgi:hypothetical protein